MADTETDKQPTVADFAVPVEGPITEAEIDDAQALVGRYMGDAAEDSSLLEDIYGAMCLWCLRTAEKHKEEGDAKRAEFWGAVGVLQYDRCKAWRDKAWRQRVQAGLEKPSDNAGAGTAGNGGL